MNAKPYQPKTGVPCSCKRGMHRDNCPQCEGTGWRIDFRAIRERTTLPPDLQAMNRVENADGSVHYIA